MNDPLILQGTFSVPTILLTLGFRGLSVMFLVFLSHLDCSIMSQKLRNHSKINSTKGLHVVNNFQKFATNDKDKNPCSSPVLHVIKPNGFGKWCPRTREHLTAVIMLASIRHAFITCIAGYISCKSLCYHVFAMRSSWQYCIYAHVPTLNISKAQNLLVNARRWRLSWLFLT